MMAKWTWRRRRQHWRIPQCVEGNPPNRRVPADSFPRVGTTPSDCTNLSQGHPSFRRHHPKREAACRHQAPTLAPARQDAREIPGRDAGEHREASSHSIPTSARHLHHGDARVSLASRQPSPPRRRRCWQQASMPGKLPSGGRCRTSAPLPLLAQLPTLSPPQPRIRRRQVEL